jgi:hypothetical protein
MNIVFGLNVLGWHIGTFDVRIELDAEVPQAAKPVIDRGVKRMTRWWTGRMAS